ncbi:MAG TPA: SCO family protein [Gaiellaceae bacterium]
MSTHDSSVVDSPGASRSRAFRRRLIWGLWALALAVGVGAGAAVALIHRHHAPAIRSAPPLHDVATWAAGTRPAPDFRLTDQHGTPFSLHDLRGKPAIVTFIDPLCRNMCPLEAKVLTSAIGQVPAAKRPTIVAVSVNPPGDTKATFAEDRTHWRLPPQWRWGAANERTLAKVWKDYAIGVQTTSKTIAGVTVQEVEHTEAAYIVDGTGHERALLLYPFQADDVLATLRQLDR